MTYKNDLEYRLIVEDIIDSDDFKRLYRLSHHGTTRAEHSLRVSYASYKKARRKHLDYVSAARAGLLHDFFFTPKYKGRRKQTEMFVNHPSIALYNAEQDFDLNDIEKDAILNHMYPATPNKPKYREGRIISHADKRVAIREFTHTYRHSKVA